MQKNLARILISLFVGVVIFLILLEVIGRENVLKAVSLLFSLQGLVLVFITVLAALVNIFKWRFVLKSQGNEFSFQDVAGVWMVGFALTYLTPIAVVGGEAARIFIMRKKFPSLPLSRNIASVGIDKVLDVTIFLLFLLAGLWAFSFYGWFPDSFVAIAAGVLTLALLSGVFFFYIKSVRNESILNLFFKSLGIKREKIERNGNGKLLFEVEKEVFWFFSPDKRFFWQGLFLSFLRYFLLFLRAALLVFFLTREIAFLKSLAVFGFVELASLLPLPATLGGLEALEAVAFGIMALGVDNSLVFSLVLRAADLFMSLIGCLFLIKYGVGAVQAKIGELFKEKSLFNQSK